MSEFIFFTERTICFPLRGNQVLLGMKKKGFGKLKYNGFGGKLEFGETAEEAAIRELFEESNLSAKKENLEERAIIDFDFIYKPEWNQRVHVYVINSWNNEPVETEEMIPGWFDIDKIPYTKMWDSDKIWLPLIINGERIKAYFTWKEDNNTINNYKIDKL